MYRQFNVQQFYVLPTQCICVFCVDLRTNSDYFPIIILTLILVKHMNCEHGVLLLDFEYCVLLNTVCY